MPIAHSSPAEISSIELAMWIEGQGEDIWWNVDGDPLLTGQISFPCPANELANELRRLNRPLLVHSRSKAAIPEGTVIDHIQLERFVSRLGDNIQLKGGRPAWMHDRVIPLSWKNDPERVEWLLIEDDETSESSRADSEMTKHGK